MPFQTIAQYKKSPKCLKIGPGTIKTKKKVHRAYVDNYGVMHSMPNIKLKFLQIRN